MSCADPFDFVTTALAHLPDDPAECSASDMAVLAATAKGLARLTAEIHCELREAARWVLVADDEAVTPEAVERCERVAALSMAGERAHSLLDSFTARALDARGFTTSGTRRATT